MAINKKQHARRGVVYALSILLLGSASSSAIADGVHFNKEIENPLQTGGFDGLFGRNVEIQDDLIFVNTGVGQLNGELVTEVNLYQKDIGGFNNWGFHKALGAPGETGGWAFGILGISVDGETVAIGASGFDGNGVNGEGAVFLFERDLGGIDNWGDAGVLLAPTPESSDGFGFSTDLDGDFCIVGVPGRNIDGFNNVGESYIFQRTGPQLWTLVKTLVNPSPPAGDRYGQNVLIENDIAIIGSREGAIYIYERDLGGVGNWGLRLQQQIPDGVSGFGANFGEENMAIQDGILFVPADFDDEIVNSSGAVYIFGRDAGGLDNWGMIKKLKHDTPGLNDRFASSFAVEGDLMLVGAAGNINSPFGTRGFYLYSRDFGGDDNWGFLCDIQHASMDVNEESYRANVAISDNVAVIGIETADGAAEDTGAAYIFDRLFFANLGIQDCNENGVPDALEVARGDESDCNDNLILDSCEIADGLVMDANLNGIPDECEENPACLPGDINNDGVVDTADLGILIGSFGFSCP